MNGTAARVWAILVTSLRQMLLSKRSYLLALLSLLPALLTLLMVGVKVLNPAAEVLPPAELMAYQAGFFLWPMLPLAGILFGGAVIADEVEAGTFVYIWARPVPRWALVLGRTLAAAAATTVVVCLGVLALGAVSLLAGVRLRHFLQMPLAFLAVALAALAYAALFGAFGSWFRRSMVAGLAYALIWETFVTYIPGSIRYLTISHYARSLFPWAPTEEGWFGAALKIAFEPTPWWAAVLALAGAAAAVMAAHTLWLHLYELRLTGGES